jgi:hypothetical protein
LPGERRREPATAIKIPEYQEFWLAKGRSRASGNGHHKGLQRDNTERTFLFMLSEA